MEKLKLCDVIRLKDYMDWCHEELDIRVPVKFETFVRGELEAIHEFCKEPGWHVEGRAQCLVSPDSKEDLIEATILISASGEGYSFDYSMFTIGHEMGHVKQYQEKTMVHKGEDEYWKGKLVKPEDYQYYVDLPWERDADKTALKLFNKYTGKNHSLEYENEMKYIIAREVK